MPQQADTTQKAEIFPTIKTITRQGVETLNDEFLTQCYAEAT